MSSRHIHPYETYLFQGFLGKYGKRFLNKYPNARYLFRFERKFEVLYSRLRNFLKGNGYNFEIIGDKFPRLDISLLDALKNFIVIFTIRDIRTWLCKNYIIASYFSKRDVVPIAIDYCSHFLKSFLLKDILHIRMQDLIHKNHEIIKKIGAFLNLTNITYLNNWWKKIDLFPPDHPKNILGWQEAHPSSKIKPENEDMVTILNSNPFWDSLLPIFDKYFEQVDKSFTAEEIYFDIESLKSLMRYSPLSINEVYKSYRTISILEQFPKNSRQKFSSIKRLIDFIIYLLTEFRKKLS